MGDKIVFDGELSKDFVQDSDIVVVSGADGNYRTIQRDALNVVIAETDANDVSNDEAYAIDRPGFRITLDRDEETEKRIADFGAVLRRESDERERRRRNGFDAAAIALVAAMSASSHRGGEPYRWTQKSIYSPPEPDHEAHMSAAELKRKRKAEKRQKIADKNQGKGA
ncbi:hypothetical protein [Mesorhizobium sp. SP-1A]|uniref:hypothetical protein n=1 Tax=Mesorhizobium sp. SP-1A TaxID=3077840 RepID=UPI0028F71555|nr:hypothetical protein [Mesorhizobium sp. SP-1A]